MTLRLEPRAKPSFALRGIVGIVAALAALLLARRKGLSALKAVLEGRR